MSRSGLCSTRGRTGTARAVGRLTLLTIAGLAIAIGSGSANAENPDISSRRAAERTDFTNDEIKDGFFKIAFHAEFQLDKPAERVRKFDEPVRILVTSNGSPDRRAEIATVVADIRSRVNHLDVAITDNRKDANFVVMLVEKHNLIPTIRSRYGADRAKQIQRSLHPQCLSGIGKDELYRIRRAEVICRSMLGSSPSTTAPMKNCCRRSARSMTTSQCPGQCSTTTSKWASSTSTTSIFSTSCTTRGFARG